MKCKKLLKWGLPFLGLTAIAVSLPVTLTACSSVKALEPKDPNKITPAAQNFTNSYKKTTIVTNQQAADADLLSQFNKLTDAQKQKGFSNDLQNYVNSLYTYGEHAFPGMIDNPQFSNWDGKLPEMLMMFKMKGDPNKLGALDPSYLARYYVEPQVYDIKWSNGKLAFTFDMNTILQIKKGTKVIAQVNIVTRSQYSNLTITPICVLKSGIDSVNRHYATWVITAGNLTVTQEATDIITNQNTPIDSYFKSNINKTFYTSKELEGNPEVILAAGFKLMPESKYTIKSDTKDVINLGLEACYWNLALNGDKPINIQESDPIIFMAPSLGKVYQFNGSNPNTSDQGSSHITR